MHHRIDRRRVLAALGGIGGLALAPLAGAQAFTPGQPIKVLIGVPAGGTQDVLTRAIAHEVRDSLGPLIIDNRSGAAGRIAVEAVKTAAPDGRTLLLGTAGMMTMFPGAYRNLSYDPIRDFVPIVNAARFELALVVGKDVPANTLPEFLAWAKAQGDQLSFASYGAGTPSHFLGEMLNRSAGLKMVHVPYRGSTPARQDVMGGTIPVYFDTVGGALQMLPTGRVKVLATSGDKRSPLAPNIPTFKEVGYTVHVWASSFGMHMPLGTPKPIADKLHDAIVKVASDPEFQKRHMIARGLSAVLNSPEEFAKEIETDIELGRDVVKASGLYPDVK